LDGALAICQRHSGVDEMTDGLKFRDISALEVLRDGQSEAMGKLLEAAVHMDGFAKGADMRFAAIEARLTALEQRWNPDTAPVHQVSEELRQKLAREANEPQARHEPDAGVRGVERDDPAV
jgi:hypothetical protein